VATFYSLAELHDHLARDTVSMVTSTRDYI